jgi:hypothetical protein
MLTTTKKDSFDRFFKLSEKCLRQKLSHGSIVFVSVKVGFGKTFAQMAKFGSIWQLGRPGTDTMILKIFFAKKCEK